MLRLVSQVVHSSKPNLVFRRVLSFIVSSASGNNARIWMTMQRIFLHVPCSDAVKECHWPACLRKHVRCDGMTSSVSPQCLDRLRIQILRQSTETLEGAKCPLQPAVMCSVSGPPEEPASLGVEPRRKCPHCWRQTPQVLQDL